MLSIADLLNPTMEPIPPTIENFIGSKQHIADLGVIKTTGRIRGNQQLRAFIAREEGPTPEERWEYERIFQLQETRWETRDSYSTLIRPIRDLPVGYRTSIAIEGFTLGEVCRKLVEAYGRGILKGLYFNGNTHDFRTSVGFGQPTQRENVVAGEGDWYTPKFLERSVDSVFIHFYPLIKVNWLEPALAYDSWETYYNEVTSVEGGSDMDGYAFLEGSYICRMAPPSNGLKRKIFNTRTAGLANIITEPTDIPFSVTMEDSVTGQTTHHHYQLFIPAGDGNCVEAAFEYLMCILYQNDLLGERAGYCWDNWISWSKAIFETMQNKGQSRKKKKTKKLGYTTDDLRFLYEACKRQGIIPHLYYEFNDIRWGDRMGRLGSGQIRNSYEIEDYTGHMFMVQMNELGFIFNNEIHCYLSKDANDPKTASNLLHALAVYPHPSRELFHSSEFRNRFRQAIERITTLKMQEFIQCMKGEFLPGDPLPYASSMDHLVLYQKKRYNQDLTKTLIFQERSHTNTAFKKKRKENEEYKPDTILFAYDLETVLNCNEAQPMVWGPFRKIVLPNAEPMETQIPFSAQWCTVNASDEGEFAKRKEEAGLPLNIYESNIPLDQVVPNVKLTLPPIVVSEYLLTEPVTEYGEEKLGKCVEDMLTGMALEVVSRGGKSGIAYAHNGAGFDAYIVLQFSRFQVDRILKTSRGIMSVTISVPVGDQIIPIALRDTRLHVAGSLAALCKGFGVPPAWCKLDFPIDKVNYTNCYHPDIRALCEPYGVNDVKGLAFIIVKISNLIGNSRWQPCNIHNTRPPIAQFLTCMSMVRASTRNHFINVAHIPLEQLPRAVDVPALRIWMEKATIGGRVNAYAKTFISKYWKPILKSYMEEDQEQLKNIHKAMIQDQACMRVLDVTSLYPTTQAKCPMPTGMIHFIGCEDAKAHIDVMECQECRLRFSLCPIHDAMSLTYALPHRPFSIIRVKNLRWGHLAKVHAWRALSARRLNSHAGSNAGLEYTLEDSDEMTERYGKERSVLSEIQSYTNIDLYWMRREGMHFEVIDGFTFEMSTAYSSFIAPAFQERIQAKQSGNKLLSDFLKLNYNGSFGVTAQQNIDSTSTVATFPEELRHLHPTDPEVTKFILEGSSISLNADEEIGDDSYPLPSGQTLITKKKRPNVAEYFMEQSPIQIGCAILANARHIMNLIMFHLPQEDQTYTDTDSIALTEKSCLKLEEAGIINNADNAPLGSLKNDHLDGNGKEPRVVMSLIGTKKVKMHITLNEKGELKVFNTFKGLNPSDKNDEGKRMPGNWVEYQIASALNQISEFGYCDPLKVSQWRKSVGFGVKIGEHMQSMESATYLGHSKGILVYIREGIGYFEYFIPHGSSINSDYRIFGQPLHQTHFYPIKKELLTNLYKITDPNYRIYQFTWFSDWKSQDDFFKKYYHLDSNNTCESYDAVHRMESVEYDQILQVFEKLQ